MKRSQVTIAVVAVFAVALVYVVTSGGGGGDDGGGGGDGRRRAAARRRRARSASPFAYSPEKEVLLKPLIQRFNESEQKVGDKQVFVEGSVVASGDAERKIAEGRLETVAWSPASSLWGRLLNFEADAPVRRRRQPVDRPHAARDRDVGADGAGARLPAQVDRLQRHPQAGDLQPGLGPVRQAAVRQVQAGPHQPGLLHLRAVGRGRRVLLRHRQEGGPDRAATSRARARASRSRDIERSIVHYGDTTLFIADQMRKRGPGLRVGRRDGGGDAPRLQQEPRRRSRS